MPSPFRPLAVVCTVGAAVMLLGACAGAVSEGDLEEKIAAALFDGFGAYPAVSCDGDLPAEVDAMTSCSAFYTDTLETIQLDVTVTSVEGTTVNYEFAPAD